MSMNLKYAVAAFAFSAMSFTAIAQQKADTVKSSTTTTSSADSLLSSMDAGAKAEPVIAFKATRLVLSQTTKTVKKNNLNFQVIHRFGDIGGKNHGPQTDFGLDQVNDVFIGFEYGITDNLNIDFARSTILQLLQLELKYALLHQTSDNSVPFDFTVLGEYGVHPYGHYGTYSGRESFLAQAILARRFSSFLSLQVSPGFVHDNTPNPFEPGVEKQYFSLQATARIKLTKHSGFIIDYAHSFSSFRTTANGFYDPLGFGYEVETGGHVFTINVTNARAVSELNYLSSPDASYGKGQYRIGFTISRMFDFSPGHSKKKYKE
jgi:hypothetical protein